MRKKTPNTSTNQRLINLNSQLLNSFKIIDDSEKKTNSFFGDKKLWILLFVENFDKNFRKKTIHEFFLYYRFSALFNFPFVKKIPKKRTNWFKAKLVFGTKGLDRPNSKIVTKSKKMYEPNSKTVSCYSRP